MSHVERGVPEGNDRDGLRRVTRWVPWLWLVLLAVAILAAVVVAILLIANLLFHANISIPVA